MNVFERMDKPWLLPAEVMCELQHEKTFSAKRRGIRGSPGVYSERARTKMEILAWKMEHASCAWPGECLDVYLVSVQYVTSVHHHPSERY